MYRSLLGQHGKFVNFFNTSLILLDRAFIFTPAKQEVIAATGVSIASRNGLVTHKSYTLTANLVICRPWRPLLFGLDLEFVVSSFLGLLASF